MLSLAISLECPHVSEFRHKTPSKLSVSQESSLCWGLPLNFCPGQNARAFCPKHALGTQESPYDKLRLFLASFGFVAH